MAGQSDPASGGSPQTHPRQGAASPGPGAPPGVCTAEGAGRHRGRPILTLASRAPGGEEEEEQEGQRGAGQRRAVPCPARGGLPVPGLSHARRARGAAAPGHGPAPRRDFLNPRHTWTRRSLSGKGCPAPLGDSARSSPPRPTRAGARREALAALQPVIKLPP